MTCIVFVLYQDFWEAHNVLTLYIKTVSERMLEAIQYLYKVKTDTQAGWIKLEDVPNAAFCMMELTCYHNRFLLICIFFFPVIELHSLSPLFEPR